MRRVHINGVEYEYQVGSSGVGVRNTVTRKRTHYTIAEIGNVVGGFTTPILPRHIKFFLMRKMGLPTPVPWNLGDLLGWRVPIRGKIRFLVLGLDDEFTTLFNLKSGKREIWHNVELAAHSRANDIEIICC